MRRKSKVHYWVCVGCGLRYRAKTKKGAIRAINRLHGRLNSEESARINYVKFSFRKGHRIIRTYYLK